MSFIETEASIRYEVIDGKKIPEALADVQDPNSNTKAEHIRRDVDITVESIPLGAGVNIF
jgi:hypothetical protein